MNERDLSNLTFLLSVAEPVLKDWYANATPDDILYATEILSTYSQELTTRGALLKDDTVDISQTTNSILQKYMLGAKK